MHLIDASDPKNKLYVSQEVFDCMQRIPPIDPESLRPQGEWVTKSWWQRKTKYTVNVCSVCKSNVKPKLKTNYCPNCGAKMKGAGEDADS